MKRLFAVLSLAIILFCFTSCQEKNDLITKPYNEKINIIPAPLSLTQGEGFYLLSNKSSFYAVEPEVKKVAEFFAAKLNTATGYSIKVVEKEAAQVIMLLIDESLNVNDEGYTLDVTTDKVTVKAKTAQGIFYGMQSFMQLLPAEIESPKAIKNAIWKAPVVSIKDEPRFEYRGVHRDVSRHFITVEEMKKHIEVLSLFKINTLHWHLTDDQGWRIEIKKYPKLTEIGGKRMEGEGYEYGGFYTQEEIKDIIDYAAERFITVIPEIELPGHAMAAIAAYPELSCTGEQYVPRIIWGVEDIVFCAGKENVFEFLENVIEEVAALFPGEYIHIGGDECPKAEWKKCPLCQQRIKEEGLKAQDGHTAEERLQSYFVQRMEKVVAKHGKKIIGWNEILEGGLAPNATIMSWQGERGGIIAANMGHDVIMTPNSNGMYIDQFEGDNKIEPLAIGGYTTIERIYDYNPMPDTLLGTGNEKHIKGVQCNTWSEYMYTSELVEYRTYPRAIALAEIAWSALESKNYDDFCRRLDNAYVRLDGHNIHYHIPQPEQPNGSCNFVAFTDEVTLEFTTSRPIKVVYTLDGSEPTPESTQYTEPITIKETTTLKIRSVLISGKMSPVREITVEKQSFKPAKEVADTKPGLNMEVYNGMFLNVDELKGKEVATSVEIKALLEIRGYVKTDESMRGVEQYGAIATGYIEIPEDDVYYVSSNNEEVWIGGELVIDNRGEPKKYSRKDKSIALAKGLHEVKVVFLGHIIGGWPSNWHDGSIMLRRAGETEFKAVTPEMLKR